MTIRESLPPTEKTPLISKRIIQISHLILADVTVRVYSEIWFDTVKRSNRFS